VRRRDTATRTTTTRGVSSHRRSEGDDVDDLARIIIIDDARRGKG
jgi:hypothetical protein